MRSASGRWRARPHGALAIRLTVVLVPVVAATAAAVVASRLIPRLPGASGTVLWFIGVLAASTLAMVVVERQARRLLPLATLLKLTLVFPDRAPSRLGVAMRAGTLRRLEKRRRHVRRVAGATWGRPRRPCWCWPRP